MYSTYLWNLFSFSTVSGHINFLFSIYYTLFVEYKLASHFFGVCWCTCVACAADLQVLYCWFGLNRVELFVRTEVFYKPRKNANIKAIRVGTFSLAVSWMDGWLHSCNVLLQRSMLGWFPKVTIKLQDILQIQTNCFVKFLTTFGL